MLTAEGIFTPLPEQVADAIPALVAYVDRDGRYRFVNKAYTEWFGQSRSAIEDHTVAEVLGDAAYAAVRSHVDGVLSGVPQHFQALVPYAHSGDRHVDVRYLPDFGADGAVRGYYALIIDRSDEEARERRLVEILDGFGDAFIAFDFEWKIAYCNRGAEAHFGFRRNEVLGRIIWDITPRSIGGPLHAFLAQAMTTRERSEGEIPSDVRPGRWISMHAFPLETGLGVSFRDITDRREQLARERQQAERLELALAAGGLGDWSWDAATDVVNLSAPAAETWGLPPEGRITWTGMQDLLHPDDRDRARLAVQRALVERTSYEIEYRIVRPADGAERWVMVRARGQYAADGEPVGMLGVLTDITRVKQEEERVRADRERLVELEQRHAFLLQVADTLRGLEAPELILAAAARLLGEHLDLGRSGYADIDDDDGMLTVREDWTRRPIQSLAGRTFPLNAFGPELVKLLREGQVIVVDDTESDPRAASHRQAYVAIDTRALVGVPLIRNGRFDAYYCATCSAPRAWKAEDVALIQDVAARTWSALARARSERALRESEARFRAMADCAPAPVWVTSAAGPMEFANEALCRFVGRQPDELLGDVWIELMHPDDVARVLTQRRAARAALTPYAFEARFRHASGEWRWLHASCRPRFDDDGAFQGYVGLAMDVTAARQAEARQQLLINELNHRVKNTLATIQSLAHQTLRDGVPRAARDRLTERLLALSAAHNVLNRENWEGAALSEIAAEAVRPYDDDARPRIALSGPPTRLAPHVALALSMALHELATNAVKYGALSKASGRVMLRWSLSEEAGPVAIEWRETGGPQVSGPPQRTGFGSRLLAQGLAAELGQPAELLYRPEGLVCRMRAPIVADA